MIKKPLIGLISLLLAVSACATEAQQLQQHIHLYVGIRSTNNVIESRLLKLLREFKDVELVPHMDNAERGVFYYSDS